MRQFVQYITLIGKVFDLNQKDGYFGLRCRSQDEFLCYVNPLETKYCLIKNLGETGDDNSGYTSFEQCLSIGRLVQIEGTLLIDGQKQRIDVRRVNLLYVDNSTTTTKSNMVFETNDWWVNQIKSLADCWLAAQFRENPSDMDFNEYRTYLDFNFQPLNTIQETATLSRLIYGLSTAYLLTGCERYLQAACNGVKYQREHFRVYKNECVFWSYGRDVSTYSTIFPSQSGDDKNTIPLYEQIYCLAGLTQYYRITQDVEVFDDIRRTVLTFIKYFKDEENGGFFSHIDPANFDYDSKKLGINQAKKNWNSIGDHIPAYLINLLLVIEPLAMSRKNKDSVLSEFLAICQDILDETSQLIVEKFPENGSAFVNERFDATWTPDHEYSWQKNRGIVGHNLKIAWNLIRVVNYYENKYNKTKDLGQYVETAERLGKSMVEIGAIDLFRGGCYDALERKPTNGMNVEFPWLPTKDFWQQEQGILAYLSLYGKTGNMMYLELAQEMSAFWNISFLDKKIGGVFFRTNENGEPVVKGSYGDKAGHAISGYHAFELCYLAHVYTCAYVTGESLFLHLKPIVKCDQVISVLPDFLQLKSVNIKSITINGAKCEINNKQFYIPLTVEQNEAHIVVELDFNTENYVQKQIEKPVVPVEYKGKIGVIVESHFDETEIRQFRDFFPQNGYQIEYLSYLWGQSSMVFTGNDYSDPLVVRKCVTELLRDESQLKDYAGFILVGAYAADRLRYEVDGNLNKPTRSPTVELLKKILQRNMKLGVICHSAWLLTIDNLMKGRKLTCANNIVSDVKNAGGIVMTDGNGTTLDIYVDGNLISGKHPNVIEKFVRVYLKELQQQQAITDDLPRMFAKHINLQRYLQNII